LFIQDFDIISELTSFVASHSSYAAEPGCHDDLVMSLVLFSWLTSQTLFKEMTDTDARRRVYEEKIKNIEEQILPFGFIDDGTNSKTFVDHDGILWHTVDDEDDEYFDEI